MTYERKAKVKQDLRRNPDQVDTSKGREYLKQGKVKYMKIYERT